MGFVNLLAVFRDFVSLFGVTGNKFNRLRKIFGVSRLEEQKRVLVKVVMNSCCSRSNHRFATREILENASRHVEIRKRIAIVRDNAHVTAVDCLNNMLQWLLSEMK